MAPLAPLVPAEAEFVPALVLLVPPLPTIPVDAAVVVEVDVRMPGARPAMKPPLALPPPPLTACANSPVELIPLVLTWAEFVIETALLVPPLPAVPPTPNDIEAGPPQPSEVDAERTLPPPPPTDWASTPAA